MPMNHWEEDANRIQAVVSGITAIAHSCEASISW
jgi:hypothetical protein